MRQDRLDALHNSGIPPHMWGAIERYIDNGIHPGGFLAAVIENDLKEAVNRADNKNIRALPEYVRWFYNHAPLVAWGYKGAIADYQRWLYDQKTLRNDREHPSSIEALREHDSSGT